ncbi:MAG TPA: DUF3093 domain-containing protein [Cellulomonas sp.]
MQQQTSPTAASPTYAERLWPATVGWVTVVGLAVMLAIALWPVGTVWGVVAGIAGLLAGTVVAVGAASRVAVTGGELVAGSAHVPVALLRDPRALDAAATRHELGPGLDARAHLCLRGWVRTAVRVGLTDPSDPTPYWVVSTRRPAALVSALHTAAGTTPDGAAVTTTGAGDRG